MPTFALGAWFACGGTPHPTPESTPRGAPAYPVLYLDMDGTLLGSDHVIRPASLEAIAEYRSCGGRVGLASGRTLDQIRPYLAEVRPDLPLVLFNGAVVFDAEGTVLRERGLDTHAPAALEAVYAGTPPLAAIAHYADGRNVGDVAMESAGAFLERSHIVVHETCSRLECTSTTKGPVKLLLVYAPETAERARDELAARLGPGARAVISDGKNGVVEVIGAETNKAEAISWVVHGLGLAGTDWMAIGDGQNDVEMVSRGALGLAMGNCHPDTCDAADSILGTNDTDAIADAIRSRAMSRSCRSRGDGR